MSKTVVAVACAVGLLRVALAAIPLDGRVYDEYLKTQPGKERKAFLREAFGGGQFDMRDIFELVAATKEDEWDVRKAAQLDKLVRPGHLLHVEEERALRLDVVRRRLARQQIAHVVLHEEHVLGLGQHVGLVRLEPHQLRQRPQRRGRIEGAPNIPGKDV